MEQNRYSRKRGSSLLLVLFISAIAMFITISMLNSSQRNTSRIVDDRSGRTAYYAADAGVANITESFNIDPDTWTQDLSELDLPDSENNTVEMDNGAVYWVNALEYEDSNKTAIVDVIGKSGDAVRKIRARIARRIPGAFDKYGLLSDGKICSTVQGPNIYMDVHTNGSFSSTNLNGCVPIQDQDPYLVLKNPVNGIYNSVITQSDNPGAGEPDPDTNMLGGYRDPVDVPSVDISYWRNETATNGATLSRSASNLGGLITNSTSKYIYIGPPAGNKNTTLSLTISGDLHGKVIFVDGNVNLDVSGTSPLKNAMIIANGTLGINGSQDVGDPSSNDISVIIAADKDITNNGSRNYKALFWTNNYFTQNGSSVAGRVITKKGIKMTGQFTLEQSGKLVDNNFVKKVTVTSSRQQVAVDDNLPAEE